MSRCSQPGVGMKGKRCTADESLISLLGRGSRLTIIDARAKVGETLFFFFFSFSFLSFLSFLSLFSLFSLFSLSLFPSFIFSSSFSLSCLGCGSGKYSKRRGIGKW